MQPNKSVVQSACCCGRRQVKAVYSCSCPLRSGGLPPRAVVNGFLHFHSNPQSGLANGPMSGPHSCTDGIAVATPMPVAFHSDHENEQHKPTAASPRHGRSIDRMWRSACGSPPGWPKTFPKPFRSGVLGSRYDHAILAKGPDHA